MTSEKAFTIQMVNMTCKYATNSGINVDKNADLRNKFHSLGNQILRLVDLTMSIKIIYLPQHGNLSKILTQRSS